MTDILFKNINIIDGTGRKAYIGDVGVKDGKICTGEYPSAEVIDGNGLTLLPGFIDVHSHGDINYLDDFASLSKLSQGITTQVTGNCSISMFPIRDISDFTKFAKGFCGQPTFPENICALSTPEGYAEALECTKKRLNFAYYTGMGSLRLYAMGYSTDKPSERHMDIMKEMLARSIESGSLGLSTGLVYVPNCYSQKEEILELLKVIKKYDAFYATHVRNESNRVIEAYDEALETAYEAGVTLFLSHFKAAGRANWGKPHKILQKVSQYKAKGMKITLDHYPYLAGMTALNVSIPPEYRKDGNEKLAEYLADESIVEKIRQRMSAPVDDYENYVIACGGFDGVLVSSCPFDHSADGMTVSEYAEKVGMEPFEAYIDILRKNKGLGLAVYFHMCEDDLLEIAQYPDTVIGSDALFGMPGENIHPRAFGTFTQGYDLYVRNKGIFTAEEFVHRATGLAAERLGFKHKGVIADGYDADLILCDLSKLKATATYKNSNQVSEGIKTVYVNGKAAYADGRLTENFSGRVIKREK